MSTTERHRYVIWALNPKVKKWLAVVGGISHQAGIEEIKERQARIRAYRDAKGKPEECRFKLLPEGQEP